MDASADGKTIAKTAFGMVPAMGAGATAAASASGRAHLARGVAKKESAAAAAAAASPDRIQSIVDKIIDERGYTHPYWVGAGIVIKQGEANTEPYRAAIQVTGQAYGCHECNKKVATDQDQPWIGDHIPPTKLSAAALTALGYGVAPARRLYPSCHNCSHLQSALVAQFNTGARPVAGLTAAEARMLRDAAGALGVNYTTSSGPKVTASEGHAVQAIGVARGCHICGTRYPATGYHADHYPPLQLQTAANVKLLEFGGLASTTFQLKPHCPKCSAAQGGRNSRLSVLLTELAREVGLAVY